ncbi:capsular polysaccharide biosynthesis protein [Nocardioides sp. BE266]|uniref:hypothetical protein n=1 Tax=Nocardioides sp. BE266 TaxID=2817725 RepID=UPI00285C5FC3|nr:hypothetical protein [Nocardioides sp. BE266]MDR7252410.1 capsular polysaccharide biosynthesis protein [Nocardioides sp. BE266]
MEMSVLWGSLRRRWYLVLALAVLTLGAMYAVTQKVGATYEATGTVLVYPPSQSSAPDGSSSQENPYLSLGGVNQARDVVVRALTSKKVSDEFGETYPVGTSFEIVPDYTNSAPIILFTVEASSPKVATAALESLVSLVPVELSNLQANLDLPEAERVASTVLTQDEKPQATSKAMIRSAILAGAGVGGAGLMLIALIDGLVLSRRSPDPAAGADGDEPTASGPDPDDDDGDDGHLAGDDEDDEAPVFVPLRPVAGAGRPAERSVTTRMVKRRRRGTERDEAS